MNMYVAFSLFVDDMSVCSDALIGVMMLTFFLIASLWTLFAIFLANFFFIHGMAGGNTDICSFTLYLVALILATDHKVCMK